MHLTQGFFIFIFFVFKSGLNVEFKYPLKWFPFEASGSLFLQIISIAINYRVKISRAMEVDHLKCPNVATFSKLANNQETKYLENML